MSNGKLQSLSMIRKSEKSLRGEYPPETGRTIPKLSLLSIEDLSTPKQDTTSQETLLRQHGLWSTRNPWPTTTNGTLSTTHELPPLYIEPCKANGADGIRCTRYDRYEDTCGTRCLYDG